MRGHSPSTDSDPYLEEASHSKYFKDPAWNRHHSYQNSPVMSSTQQQSVQAQDSLPISAKTLASTPLWQIRHEFLSIKERAELAYQRAQSVVQHYSKILSNYRTIIDLTTFESDLTADDVLHLSERYWRFHSDPILALDGSAATLLTIHYNLCLGTIATYLPRRPDLRPIVEKLVTFEWK